MRYQQQRLGMVLLLTLIPMPGRGAPAPSKDPMAVCTRHLEVIGRALSAYQRDHHELPPNLSDLYPRYVSDLHLFHCPADPTAGEPGYVGAHPDPRIPMSYFYEMSLEKDPAGVVLGPEPPGGLKTWRAMKMNSRRYFGDRVPAVRCWHHFAHPENPALDNGVPTVLSLTLTGQVFRSTPAWEYEPQFVLSALAIMERDLKLGPRHFLTIWMPVRAARYFSSVYPVTPEVSLRLHAVADHLTAAGKSGPLLADGSALTLIGTLYRTAGFTEQAVAALNRAIHAPGDHRPAAALLAEIDHQTGKDDRAISFLQELLSREPNEVQYMELLARAYRDDEQGAKADEWQRKIDNWLVGQPAPDFELTDTRGKRIRLADKRGKVILLLFWNYGDDSSLTEAAWVEEWYNKYRARDLVVYSLNDEPLHADAKGLARLTFTYPLLLDAALVFRQYGVLHVPTTYLIDSSGRVALRSVGFDAGSYRALQSAIEKLLPTQSTFLPPRSTPPGEPGDFAAAIPKRRACSAAP